jgi:hypothetical protein
LLGDLIRQHPEDPYLPLCLELWRLLSRKRGYYGCEESPLENAMGVTDEGIQPWIYQLARIGEKSRRLRGMLTLSPGAIAIRETLLDIAGHALVGIACNDALGGDEDEREGSAMAAQESGNAPSDR